MQLWNWRGLDVINAHEREPAVYLDGMRMAIEAMTRGDLAPEPLYTHRLPFDKMSAAFELLDSRPEDFMKALILCSQ